MKDIPRVSVVLESSHPISREMILGIIDYVRSHEPWNLSLIQGGPSDLKLPPAASWRGSGIIARLPTPRLAEEIASRNLPTVLIDPDASFMRPESPLSRCSHVSCDSEAVGRIAANFFLDRGYVSYAFVRAKPDREWSRRREQAFCARVSEFGRACAVYSTRTRTAVSDQAALVRWLQSLPRRTAVFAGNDVRARDVLTAALVGGLAVPDDLAVLGVNNDEIVCETALPRITSIRLDARRAGRIAAAMLAHQMRHPKGESRAGLFDPLEIVERESAGVRHTDDPVVMTALKIVQEAASRGIRINEIAARIGLSVRALEKHMNAAGISLRDEIDCRRLATVDALVRTTGLSLSAIAQRCGFASASYLATAYRAHFGCTIGSVRAFVKTK